MLAQVGTIGPPLVMSDLSIDATIAKALRFEEVDSRSAVSRRLELRTQDAGGAGIAQRATRHVGSQPRPPSTVASAW